MEEDDTVSEFIAEKTLTESGMKRMSRAWYLVGLMSLCYGVGELSHFLVGTTSRDMSQELQYGDQSCLRNDSIPAYLGGDNTTCSDFTDQQT